MVQVLIGTLRNVCLLGLQVVKTSFAGELTVGVLSLVMLAITFVLAYFTFTQFGWRLYSKVAADMRVKNAARRRKVYLLVNRFTTLLKLDFQVRSRAF